MIEGAALAVIRQLRDEHDVIERIAGVLVRWSREGQEKEPGARAVFVDFFKEWVGGLHHCQEEEILFPALVGRADVPSDRGPLLVLSREHQQGQNLVRSLEQADENEGTAAAAEQLSGLLLLHIDKENSVLLPEASERLLRNGVVDLAGRPENAEQRRVRLAAEELVDRWPPLDDENLFRSDGCMACSAFGDTCEGIEREWWNAWEWDHYRSMQE